MRLILHSGTHKTATTTFQGICFKYKELLSKDSLYYPSLIPLSENKYLMKIFHKNNFNFSEYNNHSPLAWLIQEHDFNSISKFFKTIYKKAIRLDCNNVLICGEDFENLLVDQYLAKEFSTILKNIGFENIEWVFVKRDPFSYLKSIYSELSKHNLIVNFEKLYKQVWEKGFLTYAGDFYTWKFIFDFNYFKDKFDNSLASKSSLFSFKDFTHEFVGKILLSRYLTKSSIEDLIKNGVSHHYANKSLPALNIEFRYICNYLGVVESNSNYKSNKKIFDPLIRHRQNIIAEYEKHKKDEFNKRFSYNFRKPNY